MHKTNNNFKDRTDSSSRNFANRLQCTSAHCEQAGVVQTLVSIIRTRRSLDKSLYSKIGGWSLASIAIFGLFSYLTFIPSQTFAESLTVDENEKRSLSQIDTMQEMSQQICINSRENETKQLRDTRDDKTYWVTKLKDGNCWMTQNLDYDLSIDKKITDIKDWNAVDKGGSVDMNTEAYYDPGAYYYNGSDDDHSAGTSCVDADASAAYTVVGLSSCSQFSQSGDDDHYLVGNFYSWNAAVDGTGVLDDEAIVAGEASGSICPKGWRLPTNDNAYLGSFIGLFSNYGWQDTNTSVELIGDHGIYGDPLYFVYSGILHDGGLHTAGAFGYLWSSTPRNNIYQAHQMYFTSGSLYPKSFWGRGYGVPIRCLALGGWSVANANISVTVSPVISIDATSSMTSDVDFTTIANGSITADISSNMAYQVLLSTAQTTLERNPQVENNNIPMITIDQDITAGTSSWGIKKKLSATTGQPGDITNASVYSPIGITNTATGEDNKVLFFRSATAEKRTLDFTVGIAVDPKLPSGTYSTEVTITAVAM